MIIDIVVFLTEIVKDIIFLKYCLEEKIYRLWVTGVFFALYLVIVNYDVPVTFFAMLISIITMFFVTQRAYGKVILSAVLLNSIAEVLLHFTRKISNYLDIRASEEVCYFMMNVVFVIILFLYKTALKKERIREIKISSNTIYIVLGIVVWFLSTIMTFLIVIIEYIQDEAVISLIEVNSVIGLIGLFLLLLTVLYIDRLNKKLEDAYETEHNLKEAQEAYYHTLLEKEEETRKYRHDISNHMICLKQMSERGELQEVVNYIESMDSQIHSIKHKVYDTGNQVFNIMLNYYVGMLVKEVNISLIGKFTNEIDADNYTLCTIFSNVLKNAVEEINRNNISNPMLQIAIDVGNSYTRIGIYNTSSEKIITEGKIETMKSDKKNHGMGIQNIYRAISECQGSYEIDYADGIFKTQIFLPCILESKNNDRS